MKYLLTTLLSLLAIGSWAQKPISLKECLEIGLEKNYDILIVKNDEQIADNNATAANAGMLPSLNLSAGYNGSADRTTTTPFEGEKLSGICKLTVVNNDIAYKNI